MSGLATGIIIAELFSIWSVLVAILWWLIKITEKR